MKIRQTWTGGQTDGSGRSRAFTYYSTSSNARLRRGQHPANILITQIIDLQTLFAINDRQTVQTDTQTDRQVAFIGRDYRRKYLKMRLMVGEAEGV